MSTTSVTRRQSSAGGLGSRAGGRGASVARRSTLGLYGDWESSEGGSYLLEPAGEAKGVVHFVGGAFIGAASQLTYRYLLERFASDGYLVVATPFRLSFDYLSVCDAVEASQTDR